MGRIVPYIMEKMFQTTKQYVYIYISMFTIYQQKTLTIRAEQCWCFIPSSASRIMRLAIFRARDVLLQLRGLAIAEAGSGVAPGHDSVQLVGL